MRLIFYLLLSILALHASPAFARPDTLAHRATLVKSELIFDKAPFKQCHASTIVEISGGLMAAWFGGTYERHPDVCIWGSVYTKDGWSKPVILADGIINDTLRYPCWNPVFFKTRSGELLLFYKVGPSPSEWWGMFKKSNDNGKTWSAPVRLADGILGPIKNKPVYAAGGRIISPSSVERGDVWHAHMELSDDNGENWRKVYVDSTTGYKLIQPTLLTPATGDIIALMRSNQNSIAESRSHDNGTTWSKPVTTNIPNPNSGIDAVTLAGGLHVLVYNPTPSGDDWSAGRNKLNVAVSNNGKSWKDIYTLEDKSGGEFSYPAVIQSKGGLVHITYTSNRVGIRHVVLKIE